MTQFSSPRHARALLDGARDDGRRAPRAANAGAAEDGAEDGARHGAPSGAAGVRHRAPLHARTHALASPGTRGEAHGARRTGSIAGSTAERLDAAAVIARLEEAGRALLALPNTGHSTRMRLNASSFMGDMPGDGTVYDAPGKGALDGAPGVALARGADAAPGVAAPGVASLVMPQEQVRMRAPQPSAGEITRMDEALAWIPMIPRDRSVLRRVVGCRALVHPLTDRHIYPWRRIGLLVGADHKAVQRWHAQGIDLIVGLLNARR